MVIEYLNSRWVLSHMLASYSTYGSLRGRGNLLARVALPPDGRNADMGSILHHLTVGNTGAVEHSLVSKAMLAILVSITYTKGTWVQGHEAQKSNPT